MPSTKHSLRQAASAHRRPCDHRDELGVRARRKLGADQPGTTEPPGVDQPSDDASGVRTEVAQRLDRAREALDLSVLGQADDLANSATKAPAARSRSTRP